MIDSILYGVDVPAGTYTAGQTLPLNVIKGPSVVRDGYGEAKLKQVFIASTTGVGAAGSYVEFKNANWNDSLKSMLASVYGNQSYTILAKTSPALQKCGDTGLQPNSAFDVNLVISSGVTTTADFSVFCLVDIDYPQVQAVANPAEQEGLPVTIIRNDTITTTLDGAAASMTWNNVNVDEFKAGYRYLLAQVGLYAGSTTSIGFVAFSGAPSMNGLVRIIPVIPRFAVACRLALDYSTPLVKGPMNIEYAVMDSTAQSVATVLECDYIRR